MRFDRLVSVQESVGNIHHAIVLNVLFKFFVELLGETNHKGFPIWSINWIQILPPANGHHLSRFQVLGDQKVGFEFRWMEIIHFVFVSFPVLENDLHGFEVRGTHAIGSFPIIFFPVDALVWRRKRSVESFGIGNMIDVDFLVFAFFAVDQGSTWSRFGGAVLVVNFVQTFMENCGQRVFLLAGSGISLTAFFIATFNVIFHVVRVVVPQTGTKGYVWVCPELGAEHFSVSTVDFIDTMQISATQKHHCFITVRL
mmetsp:Transcript_19931/g.37210  ORF Transcript_19931/g.37210 Transcript_19931/m.37210 type:complete len:255 (+) Transcript_19931:991-1755(+)